nr:putative agenet domain-containing protein / bromo-adjacent homology (BAH) domain-containing protein [Tanacetum cinerariifolium]
MAGSSQCFVEWKEQFVSKERGKRVVHYFLKDISGESVLAVIGTERSVRHMFYVVAEDFLKVNEAENSITAGYRWRSRREVVNWLTSMLSKQHRQGEHLKSLRSDVAGVGVSYQNRLAKNVNLRMPDIVWSGVAWTCTKQLKHFPAFCRNGMTISVQSFVYVMAVEEVRHIAYLEDMYEDKKGQKKVKVRWFHHKEEVQALVTLKNPHPKEIFITPIVQVISVECVDAPAIVLAREHYEKFVPILPDDLLTRVYLCLKQFKNSRLKPFKLSKLCGYFGQPIFSIMDSDFVVDDGISPGGKRARILRGRQVVTYDPLGMHMKLEMLRMKVIPKDVKERPAFKVNEKIEVLCQDSGIRGCWFRCSVLKVARKRIKVIYDDLKDADDIGNLEVQSFVYVMAVEEVRHIAYLEDMYEDKKGQKKVKVRWFHHKEEVQALVTLKNPHPKEIFITPIVQVISVECVDAPAIVLAREHYEKFVPILPDDLLTRVYLCLKQFKNSRLKPFKLSKLCGYFGQPIFSIMDSDFVVDDGISPGGKRARILRGRQVVTYDPLGMHMKLEMLRMKVIPKDVKERPAFKVNEKIEVLCQDSGIRGCWFRCSVLKVARKRIKVIYDDLKDADDIGNLEVCIRFL